MSILYPVDFLTKHQSVWQKLQPLLNKNHACPQALLFVGPRHAQVALFVNRFMASMLCQNDNPPCSHCQNCRMLLQGVHPDIRFVGLNGTDKVIKIEQIRDMQRDVYQTPQKGQHRFIVLEAADKMNVSSSNALLKVLEEPPRHTIFILIAEQFSRLLPTIISRCQKYRFPDPQKMSPSSTAPLSLGEYYPPESVRAQLCAQQAEILAALGEMIEEKKSPCTIAADWSTYAMEDLLWFLYLLTAQIIQYKLMGASRPDIASERLKHLSSGISISTLFKQIDQINALTQKINHNMNINPTLALEVLLLGYLRESYDGR